MCWPLKRKRRVGTGSGDLSYSMMFVNEFLSKYGLLRIWLSITLFKLHLFL